MNLEETKKIVQNKIEAEALTKNVRSQIKSYIHEKQNLREGFKETFQPLIESQDAVKTSIDNQQNAMIKLALTEGLDKNRLAINQGFDKTEEVRRWDLEQLPSFEAIEEPEEDRESITEETAKKPKIATFTDEDLDKDLKYEETIDYLDSLNLKLPSELKEMNIEEITENQLQKAEENLNDKKLKLKNSAKFINFQGKTYAYPSSSKLQGKTKKNIEEHNILSDYISNLNMLRVYKEKSGSGIIHFNNPLQLLDRLELLIGSLNAGNNGVIQELTQIVHLLHQLKVITKKQLNNLLKKYILNK